MQKLCTRSRQIRSIKDKYHTIKENQIARWKGILGAMPPPITSQQQGQVTALQ